MVAICLGPYVFVNADIILAGSMVTNRLFCPLVVQDGQVNPKLPVWVSGAYIDYQPVSFTTEFFWNRSMGR